MPSPTIFRELATSPVTLARLPVRQKAPRTANSATMVTSNPLCKDHASRRHRARSPRWPRGNAVSPGGFACKARSLGDFRKWVVMPGLHDPRESNASPERDLDALREQEQELEHLRALLKPEHWPRIYSMLDRIRQEIRAAEAEQDRKRRGAA